VKISVVIVTRNRVPLLQRALGSVDAQEHDDIEVVIIDNASDQPLSAGDLTCRFPIRLHRNERMALASVNRNRGADLAEGEIVCFLDDDDTYKPCKVREVIAAFDADPGLEHVFGRVAHVGPDGTEEEMLFWDVDLTDFLTYRYLHCNAMAVRRPVFERIRFRETMETYEDTDFVGRLIRDTRGAYLGRVHAIWHRDDRPDQLTRRNLGRARRNWIHLCREFDPEIRASRVLRRIYHRKMLVLALLGADLKTAMFSLRRLLGQ